MLYPRPRCELGESECFVGSFAEIFREIEGWTRIQLGPLFISCLVSTARMGYATRRLDFFFFQPVRAISLGFQWTWVYLRGTYVDPRRALLHGLGLNSRRASKGSPGEA